MTDERLSDLLVIAVEGDEASKIDLQEAIDLFADIKPRRYPLKALSLKPILFSFAIIFNYLNINFIIL